MRMIASGLLALSIASTSALAQSGGDKYFTGVPPTLFIKEPTGDVKVLQPSGAVSTTGDFETLIQISPPTDKSPTMFDMEKLLKGATKPPYGATGKFGVDAPPCTGEWCKYAETIKIYEKPPIGNQQPWTAPPTDKGTFVIRGLGSNTLFLERQAR